METVKKTRREAGRERRVAGILAATGFEVPADWGKKEQLSYITEHIYGTPKWGVYFSITEVYRQQQKEINSQNSMK